LRFYRDGLGLDLLQDRHVEGDWPDLSFFVDVEATLSRLAALGLGGPPRRVTQSTPRGPVTLTTVRDPDGLLVLLTPGSITRSA
jgi:catechol 2,3-dioxygenase-like lactoylglutathione lyase family enzyme